MTRVTVLLQTYIWTIFVIFIVLLLLGISHVLEPQYTCTLSGDLYCKEVRLMQDSIRFTIVNEGPAAIISGLAVQDKNLACQASATVSVAANSEQTVTLPCTITSAKFYDAAITALVNGEAVIGTVMVKV